MVSRLLAGVPVVVAVVACAKASNKPGAGPLAADASCGDHCDQDGDGVFDGMDQCPDTPAGQPVNQSGCADSQLTPMLYPNFPPFGLGWTQAGDLGRAGGLTWTYTGIQRGDLFHIYWIVCDDPATPCGLSLDGPIDAAGESWTFDAADSMLAAGKLVFSNATQIALADGTTPTLTGRLTLTIVDGADNPIAFAPVATLGVPARLGTYGAEIPGTAYTVTALGEVEDPTSMAWTPFLDYYDAQPTAMAGGDVTVSFGGSFYAK